DNTIKLMKAGVPLLLATDAGLRDPDAVASQKPRARLDQLSELHEGEYLWFQAMAENGMKPMDAIQAATRNVAAAYHKLDQFGTLEKGKLADLVVIDADPLDDLNNIRKISMVMQAGRVVDRGKLPSKHVLTAPRSTRVVITTELGDIELELDANRAPVTVANFLKYVDGGFHHGGVFPRPAQPA